MRYLIISEEFISKDNNLIRDWLKSTKQSFKEKNFPILSFLDLLLKDETFISKRNAYIFKYYLNYFENSKKINLGDIGKEFSISRERVRQLAFPENLEIPIWNKIKSLLGIFPKDVIDLEKYNVEASLDLVLLDSHSINDAEKTNFSLKFIFKFLSLILDEFQFINKDEFAVNNTYLVKKEILDFFDIKTALFDINNLLEQKIEASFNLNLKGFLSDYINKSNNWQTIDRIVDVFEKILFEEYGILTDFEGNITIEKNTRKAVY